MSLPDRPSVPPHKVLGCIAYGVTAACVVVAMFFVTAMSECTPAADASACDNGSLIRFLMFPGSFVAALGIGILMARWALRDDDHD